MARKSKKSGPPAKASPEVAKNPELISLEKNLEEKIPQLRNLSQNDRLKLVSAVQMSVRTVSSSPFPPPEFIKTYAELIPDGAERLLKAAENQAAHRMQLENFAVRKQQTQADRGQWFAFIIALVCVGAALAAALSGHDTFAGVLGSTTIIGLVGAFIAGKSSQRKSLKRKSDD